MLYDSTIPFHLKVYTLKMPEVLIEGVKVLRKGLIKKGSMQMLPVKS